MTTKTTRHNVLAAILAATDIDAALAAADIDATEGREVAERLLKSLEPKSTPKSGPSRAARENAKLFAEIVRPWMERNGGIATAADIAKGCDGLPVSSKGTTATQKVTAILKSGLVAGAVEFADDDTAKAYRKAHKGASSARVYRLAA